MALGGKDELKAGLILLAALFFFGSLVVAIGGTRLFAAYDLYSARFQNVAGVESGTVVRLGGMKVGKVLEVRSLEGDPPRVELLLGVERGTAVQKGTVAQVATLGIVGDYYVQLRLPARQGEPLTSGSVLPSEEATDMGTLMGRLSQVADATEQLLKNANALLDEEARADIKGVIKTLNREVASASVGLQATMADIRQAARRLDGFLVEGTALVAENRQGVQETVASLRAAAQRGEQVLGGLEKTVDQANRLLAGSSEPLRETLQNLAVTSENLRDLTQEVKDRPWIFLYRPETREGMPPRVVPAGDGEIKR